MEFTDKTNERAGAFVINFGLLMSMSYKPRGTSLFGLLPKELLTVYMFSDTTATLESAMRVSVQVMFVRILVTLSLAGILPLTIPRALAQNCGTYTTCMPGGACVTVPRPCPSTGHDSQGRFSPGAAVISLSLVGGGVTALGGSFDQNPQGQTVAVGAGLLGFGTMGTVALLINDRKLSRPAVITASTLFFAANGAGAAMAYNFQQQINHIVVPTPTIEKNAAIGGGAGALVGVAIGFKLLHLTGSLRPGKAGAFNHVDGHLQLALSPQYSSMRFTW